MVVFDSRSQLVLLNFQNHETHYKLKNIDNFKHYMNVENGPTNTDGGSYFFRFLFVFAEFLLYSRHIFEIIYPSRREKSKKK